MSTPGVWKEALKDWDLSESELVSEWKAEAQQECILQVLEVRVGKVPADLFVRISRVKHRPMLRGWLAIAATCAALDDFRQRIVSLADVIECQFGRVPLDILARINQCSDWSTIQKWTAAAINARTENELRAAIGLPVAS